MRSRRLLAQKQYISDFENLARSLLHLVAHEIMHYSEYMQYLTWAIFFRTRNFSSLNMVGDREED